RAKAAGRGTFCFFRDEMAATVEARRILELDLRKALANEEFELFYQPLVNLKSGKITTCEALLRWNHPVRGTVSPVDIIPVAEDMGLIVDLGPGYSSFSYLHNFPMQKVKIDRSFLEGIDTDRPLTLLRGVARLSADLGMAVVVEGIETNEQLELISADGTVSEAQGYLFSRPVPAVRMRQLLNASHGRRASEDQLVVVTS